MKIKPKAPWFISASEPGIDFSDPDNMVFPLLACPNCDYQPIIIDRFPWRCPQCYTLTTTKDWMAPTRPQPRSCDYCRKLPGCRLTGLPKERFCTSWVGLP